MVYSRVNQQQRTEGVIVSTMGRMGKALVGMASVVMLATGCIAEDKSIPTPAVNNDPNRYSDLAVMKEAWNESDPENRASICDAWREDTQASLDLFHTSYGEDGDDWMPARATVLEFFNEECWGE